MATNIPKGNSKEDVYIRRAIIVQHLAPLIGKSVPCSAFSPRQVKVVFASVDETATHAAKRYESTCAALQLKRLLRTATIVKNTAPHSNKQKKMGFVKVYELASLTRNRNRKDYCRRKKKHSNYTLLYNKKRVMYFITLMPQKCVLLFYQQKSWGFSRARTFALIELSNPHVLPFTGKGTTKTEINKIKNEKVAIYSGIGGVVPSLPICVIFSFSVLVTNL